MRAQGIEVDRESVDFARGRDLNIVEGAFPRDLPRFAGTSFDFIRSMHVLEHVLDPHETLRSLVSLLRSGGFLVLGVPDQGSVPALIKQGIRSFGMRRDEWGFVQPPIHLHGFRTVTIRVLAEKLGLELRFLRRTSPLNQTEFPATANYWRNIRLQKTIYQLGRILGSAGHLLAGFQKVASKV
jgi:SAM-dependent methyltransferase